MQHPLEEETKRTLSTTFQGIDLSNVIKDMAISNDSETIETSLKQLSAHLVSKDVKDVPGILQRLQTELDKDIARKMLAAKHGAYRVLIDIMRGFKGDVEILRPAIKTMTSLMTGYPDLLDETGIALQIELINRKFVNSIK